MHMQGAFSVLNSARLPCQTLRGSNRSSLVQAGMEPRLCGQAVCGRTTGNPHSRSHVSDFGIIRSSPSPRRASHRTPVSPARSLRGRELSVPSRRQISKICGPPRRPFFREGRSPFGEGSLGSDRSLQSRLKAGGSAGGGPKQRHAHPLCDAWWPKVAARYLGDQPSSRSDALGAPISCRPWPRSEHRLFVAGRQRRQVVSDGASSLRTVGSVGRY